MRILAKHWYSFKNGEPCMNAQVRAHASHCNERHQLCCLPSLWWVWKGRSIPAAVTNDMGDVNAQVYDFHDSFAERNEAGSLALHDIMVTDKVRMGFAEAM